VTHLPAFPVAQPQQARLAAYPATTPPRLKEFWDAGRLMVVGKKLLQQRQQAG